MEIATHFGFKAIDDLIVSVGYGKITPLQLIRKFEPKSGKEEVHESFLDKIIGRVRKKKTASGVMVKGWTIFWCVSENAVTRFPGMPLQVILPVDLALPCTGPTVSMR